MEGCAGQPLLATDDVGNLHQVVVHNVGQMVRGQLVLALVEHLVVADLTLHAHLTANHVVDEHLLVGLHLEAHHPGVGLPHQPLHLLLGKGQRVAHLRACAAVVLEILHLIPLRLQFLGGVKGHVCLAVGKKLVNVLFVNVAALALAVGAVVAAEGDTLVKLYSQPVESLDDIRLGTGHEAGGVGVLNTEHKVAAVLAGKEVIVKGGTHAANVKGACRAGCKAHPDTSV